MLKPILEKLLKHLEAKALPEDKQTLSEILQDLEAEKLDKDVKSN